MKVLFALCSALIILQILDVPITSVSAAPAESGKTTAREQAPPRTAPGGLSPNTASKPAENQAEPNATDVDNNTISGAKNNFRTMLKQERNDRGVGIIKTIGGFIRLGSQSLGLLGRGARGTTAGIQRIADHKYKMASSVGNSLVDGHVDVMDKLQSVGGQGKATLSSTSGNVARLASSAIKTTGAMADVPISVASDGLDVLSATAKVPIKLSKSASSRFVNFVDKRTEDKLNNDAEDQPPPGDEQQQQQQQQPQQNAPQTKPAQTTSPKPVQKTNTNRPPK